MHLLTIIINTMVAMMRLNVIKLLPWKRGGVVANFERGVETRCHRTIHQVRFPALIIMMMIIIMIMMTVLIVMIMIMMIVILAFCQNSYGLYNYS